MSEVTINSQKADMTEEEQQNNIVLGFDEAGFFCLKAHIKLGKWNLWGILEEARLVLLSHFTQKRVAEQEKKLVRPNGLLDGFRKKWH